MENNLKPPGKRKSEKRTGPATAPENDGKRQQPASAERTDGKVTPQPIAGEGTPSGEEVISKFTQPVTNQDEQEKITNADGDDIPRPAK